MSNITDSNLPLHPSSIRDLLNMLTFLSDKDRDEIIELAVDHGIRPFDESHALITAIAQSGFKFDTVAISSALVIRGLNFKVEDLPKAPALVGYRCRDNRKVATLEGYR
jgi:hypothetical protein